MLQHKDYKVGWICALPKEQTAAIAMLDEEHEGLSQPPSDSNAYILGSIGGHNIVIACLPMGIYGTVTAATVAANMTRTFPAIRFGLMVGIGGGIPPKVRLGDVVSVPRDTHPGVVQWDMGKTEQGGTFRRTGALNNPPTLLLTALSSLESKRKFGKSRVQRYVEEIHLKFPDLDENYLKSDFLKDVLFDQGYPHQGEAINCEDCAKDRTIERGAAKFTVHYGTIASGNQVIKDAIFRESLVKDLGGDVLCIEMEAAGLMSNFPCIVIRGICDYADSHKNKAWQEHAAGVAAGFAKDLLGHIMVDRVAAEKAAKDVLSKVDQTVTTIGKVTTEMHQLLHNKEDMEVLNWLSLNHYGSEQSEALRRWHPGTCQWFLCSRRFQAWLENKGQALYCPGIPGAGKTTMSAAVIYDISCRFPTDSNVGIAYVYFAFSRQHEQTVEHVLASLLMQLLRRQTSMPDFIRKIHENHVKAGTRAMRGELFDALSHLIPRFKRAYIVLDALDECTTDNGCRKEVLSTILALRNSTGLSILVTSRPHEEIASFFSHRDSIPIRAQDNDVSVFLHSHLEAQDTDVFDGPIRSLVASRVTCVAEGMFLLARLHINTLVEIPTKKKVKIALEGLVTGPDGLHDVYEQTMRRIQSQGRGRRELAELILIWIVYARRPLSIRELQQALGVEPDSGQMDEDNIPSIKTLQSVCAGLVQVDEGSDMVGLIHYTTQEYFEKTRSQWFPDAQRYITQTCVAYLSLPNLGGYCIDARKFEERHEAHPFYDYAAQEWGHHARELSVEPHVIDFLQRKEAVEGVIQALMVHKRFRYNVWDLRNPYWSERFPKCMNGLHLAALLGLHFAVQALLIVFDVNDHDSRGRTPLAVAAEEGHSEVAELLLRTGSADVDKIDCYGSTALLLAAGRGHSDVFEMLVKTGKVDVNRTNSLGQTSLSMAAEKGYAHILKLLLDTGRMDVNSTDIRGKTPLVAAADGGHVAVAKLLLETGKVDINAAEYGQTPLLLAAKHGYSDIVKLLLETGVVAINRTSPCGRTPLLAAVDGRHLGAAKLLIETGEVDIDVVPGGQTPLILAARKGHFDMVKLLIEAENLEQDRKKLGARIALLEAIKHGHWDVVQGLLELGQAQDGQFAIIEAASYGHLDMIAFLIETEELDVGGQDEYGRTALVYAARHGRWQNVRHLVETTEVEVDRGDEDGRTALMYAARYKRLDMVRLLVETGKAGLDKRDQSGQTAVIHAVQHGAAAVVCLLLDSGADAGMVDNVGYSALDYAVFHKDRAIEDILVLAGASLEMSSARTTLDSYTEIDSEP